jgi:FdhD protein
MNPTEEVRTLRIRGDEETLVTDTLIVEEPLEIRLNDVPIAVTMRTPQDDRALAVGFLITEGLLRDAKDLLDITQCADEENPDIHNVVTVYLRPESVTQTPSSVRQRYAVSSCGLCGRAVLDDTILRAAGPPPPMQIDYRRISEMPSALRRVQQLFEATGALHAAGLFVEDGRLLASSEDIGRHNAVDRVIGRSFLEGVWPLPPTVLLISGRPGFEIVQKAAAAGISVVAGISGPSSLAVQLARETGVGLVGFVRDDRMNIYSPAPNEIV